MLKGSGWAPLSLQDFRVRPYRFCLSHSSQESHSFVATHENVHGHPIAASLAPSASMLDGGDLAARSFHELSLRSGTRPPAFDLFPGTVLRTRLESPRRSHALSQASRFGPHRSSAPPANHRVRRDHHYEFRVRLLRPARTSGRSHGDPTPRLPPCSGQADRWVPNNHVELHISFQTICKANLECFRYYYS